MEKLNELIGRCKCGVHVDINSHRDYYETVEYHMNDSTSNKEYLEDIESDVYEKMKEMNTIIDIQFYPTTPVGFYRIFHYDLEMAINKALEILKQDENEQ